MSFEKIEKLDIKEEFDLSKIEIKEPTEEEIISYYSRKDILKEMIKIGNNREFVGAFRNGAYSKRPSVIQYENDIIEMVKNGVISFHCSVERWKNPMLLSTDIKNYDEIRIGFDFIIDIDSKIGIEAGMICAQLVCDLLKKYNIKSYGVKFSGSRGFHIILPFEAFPKEIDFENITKQYPKIPRILSEFIREKIKDELLERLVERYTMKNLLEITKSQTLDPYNWVEIEKGWGERHLFRVPYSINEKTWLISVPIEEPKSFNLKMAVMSNVRINAEFFKIPNKEEAEDLLLDAIEWKASMEDKEKRIREIKKKEIEDYKIKAKIPEQNFPPCIKKILAGLYDGKKRSTFTLISFLREMNWSREEIEERLEEWNKKNVPPLPTSFILGQINWNFRREKIYPASCDSDLFYKSIGICEPDEICKNIKNPMAYPLKKMKINKKEEKERFFCRLCNREFKNEKGLKMHQIRFHKDEVI